MKIQDIKYVVMFVLMVITFSGGLNLPGSNHTSNQFANKVDANTAGNYELAKPYELSRCTQPSLFSEFIKNLNYAAPSFTENYAWNVSTHNFFANHICNASENKNRTTYRLISILEI